MDNTTSADGLPVCRLTHSLKMYLERVRSLQRRMNPRLLLASEADILKAKEIATLADAGSLSELKAQGLTDKMIQSSILLRDASINPSNGEILPLVLRMAAYAPVNVPICAGMLLSSPTVFNSILWQWVNQTYNAAFNYMNGNHAEDIEGNKLKEQEKKASLIKGYSAAVVVSVGMAVGLNAWLKRLNARPSVFRFLQGTVPFAAVAGANVANVFLMRGRECITGIPVFSERGNSLGISKRAGFEAVLQTAISRIVFPECLHSVLPVPILLLPSPIISLCNWAVPLTRSNAFLKILTQLSVIYGCLSIGLPMAVAVFPASGQIPISKLEPEFHHLTDPDGQPVTHAVFNRGV